jgi:hypothetical protein
MLELATLQSEAEARGLALRGGFHPEPQDGVPRFPGGGTVLTVVLFGFVGRLQWPAFASSAEYADGRPNPLDRWSQRLIDEIGSRYGALGLYPSQGPPWLPFQRWAQRAESVYPSPLGLLIHPDYGLWHAYRGALGFRTRIALPEPIRRSNPCEACSSKPCLCACPVSALAPGHYNHAACGKHVASGAGWDCLHESCRARRSCPIGSQHRYGPEQSTFHMRAFIGAYAVRREED